VHKRMAQQRMAQDRGSHPRNLAPENGDQWLLSVGSVRKRARKKMAAMAA
jgi:hypothetical protein